MNDDFKTKAVEFIKLNRIPLVEAGMLLAVLIYLLVTN